MKFLAALCFLWAATITIPARTARVSLPAGMTYSPTAGLKLQLLCSRCSADYVRYGFSRRA
jgi:hypothetical protein